jgi:hypothetical protein
MLSCEKNELRAVCHEKPTAGVAIRRHDFP